MRLFIVCACKCWVQHRHVEQIVIKYFICKNFLEVWLILFIFKRISFLCKNSFLIRTENVALSQARRNSTEYLVYVIVGVCCRKPGVFYKNFPSNKIGQKSKQCFIFVFTTVVNFKLQYWIVGRELVVFLQII